MRDFVTVERVCELLNEALALDPEAVSSCAIHRHQCNKQLAEHETIQAGMNDVEGVEEPNYSIGIVGLINGMFGISSQGWGPIVAIIETDSQPQRVLRFEPSPSKFMD